MATVPDSEDPILDYEASVLPRGIAAAQRRGAEKMHQRAGALELVDVVGRRKALGHTSAAIARDLGIAIDTVARLNATYVRQKTGSDPPKRPCVQVIRNGAAASPAPLHELTEVAPEKTLALPQNRVRIRIDLLDANGETVRGASSVVAANGLDVAGVHAVAANLVERFWVDGGS